MQYMQKTPHNYGVFFFDFITPMKKNICTALLVLLTTTHVFAQSIDYGAVKSGCKTERTYYSKDGNSVITNISFVDTLNNHSQVGSEYSQTSFFKNSLLVKTVFVKTNSKPLIKEVSTYTYEGTQLKEVVKTSFLGEKQTSTSRELHEFDTT